MAAGAPGRLHGPARIRPFRTVVARPNMTVACERGGFHPAARSRGHALDRINCGHSIAAFKSAILNKKQVKPIEIPG
ncbi:TPA: hypothetical protein SAY52_001643 [Burkholderia cenocepacia]|uniref:hypothetical protein n=1 Tax=unclassified Burkholderia TaxID=2613784 RepID=UPI00158E1F54|nr:MULTISPECIES: hypothetical protein [unclassified Burkholderia]HEF5871056.1 hypothetical protein [Burkholderia cenocepacia]